MAGERSSSGRLLRLSRPLATGLRRAPGTARRSRPPWRWRRRPAAGRPPRPPACAASAAAWASAAWCRLEAGAPERGLGGGAELRRDGLQHGGEGAQPLGRLGHRAAPTNETRTPAMCARAYTESQPERADRAACWTLGSDILHPAHMAADDEAHPGHYPAGMAQGEPASPWSRPPTVSSAPPEARTGRRSTSVRPIGMTHATLSRVERGKLPYNQVLLELPGPGLPDRPGQPDHARPVRPGRPLVDLGAAEAPRARPGRRGDEGAAPHPRRRVTWTTAMCAWMQARSRDWALTPPPLSPSRHAARNLHLAYIAGRFSPSDGLHDEATAGGDVGVISKR